MHRGSEMTGRPLAFSVLADFQVRGTTWGGKMAWPKQSPERWARFIPQCSVRERDLFGFPRPGDPYWSDETLEGSPPATPVSTWVRIGRRWRPPAPGARLTPPVGPCSPSARSRGSGGDAETESRSGTASIPVQEFPSSEAQRPRRYDGRATLVRPGARDVEQSAARLRAAGGPTDERRARLSGRGGSARTTPEARTAGSTGRRSGRGRGGIIPVDSDPASKGRRQ